jgi:hypothetical protein
MMIGRQGAQTEERPRMALSARSIVAGVLALLIVLQGLAGIGASLARSTHFGGKASFVVSLLGATCVVSAHGDKIPPAHEGKHSQCCILCGARDFDGGLLPFITQTIEAIPPLRAQVSIEEHFADTPSRPPTGWESSWSSRAPPSFS